MYHIVIPSYNRPQLIKEKTLQLILSNVYWWGANPFDITIFVADEEQLQIYRESLMDTCMSDMFNIVVSEPGLANSRNFISRYFPEGAKLVFMDDDIEEIYCNNDIIACLNDLFQCGFDACERSGARLWGISPSTNKYYTKDTITYDLRFCVGSFYGFVNTHELHIPFDEKEDYYRTLAMWEMDKVIVRLNFVSILTNYYKNEGGMNKEDRLERQNHAVCMLEEYFPRYIRRKENIRTGFPEIAIRTSLITKSVYNPNDRPIGIQGDTTGVAEEATPE